MRLSQVWQQLRQVMVGSAAEAQRKTLGKPGYPSGFPRSERGGNREVFDPALQHFGHGFRLSDPVFANDSDAERWRTARRDVVRHLLGVVSRLPQSEHLVLRGSLLLTAWLGDAAREPGDIDWVIQPATIGVGDDFAPTLLREIVRVAVAKPLESEAWLLPMQIATDAIWLYDRAPGSRLVFPWQVAGLPVGTVQMDFVFNETLRTAPAPVVLPPPWSDGTPVLAASRAESLAWKMLWLLTDRYTQDKDLYDAVLLAEKTPLPWRLFSDTLIGSGEYSEKYPVPRSIEHLGGDNIAWDEFQTECPGVTGTVQEWVDRLAVALAPTFAEADNE